MTQLLLYPRVDLAIDQEQNLRQIVQCMAKLAEEQQEDSIGNYADLIPTFRIDAGSKIKEPNQNVYDAAAQHYAGTTEKHPKYWLPALTVSRTECSILTLWLP